MDNIAKALVASLVLMIIMFFAFFGYAFINNLRLFFYLKKERYRRWVDVTSIRGFGPGSSSLRWLKYLFSNDDNDDERIMKYKNTVKIGLKYALVMLLGLIVDIVMLLRHFS